MLDGEYEESTMEALELFEEKRNLVLLEHGYSYQRFGHEVHIKSPDDLVVVKCVMANVLFSRLKSFMLSLTKDQLKAMFK